MKSHSGSSGNGWKFTGELNDSTVGRSPYYLRARYYDPALGRFLSRDPFAGLLEAPQSLNPYMYVGDNPVLYADPRGLFCPWKLSDCVPKPPIPEPIEKMIDTVNCIGNPVYCALGAAKDKAESFLWSKTNVANEALGRGILWASGGDVCHREGGITILQNCGGLCKVVSNIMGGRSYTVGSYVFSPETLNEAELAHEMAHVEQYREMGAGFLPKYFGVGLREYLKCLGNMDCAAEHHPMETDADRRAGIQ